ncbi:unnamed protein product [Somion occarium]|uniref:Uncharacterized protein n=1 Tax=Somion occarium TaxID=3059160 RepID=A0ABP1DRN6_9APHY
MRNTLPLLSRAQAAGSSTPTATPPQAVPTIRFISATPSVAADTSTSFNAVAPFASSSLAPREDAEVPRRRLVPKKSKLGLLGGNNKAKDKANKDFSDVVRRVGGGSTNGRGGFEIYVDQADDPDLGEILVVKKKKSRLGLDGMKWGALGETTNIPVTSSSQPEKKALPSENLLKVKGDDSQKWWSIGRGRKDSKEKAKENKPQAPPRSKTPEPSKPLESRARFNSLNAANLLSVPEHPNSVRSVTSPIEHSNGLLAPPSNNEPATGSLAVRAMRSVRSIARMKSWATLSGATTNSKEGHNTNNASTNMTATTSNVKTKEKGEEKKKKKKKEKEKTVRYSGSSFEAGALSAQASPMEPSFPTTATMKKKQSILGLGLPSTMRRTMRNVSTISNASSVVPPPATMNCLSADSAHLVLNAAGRPSSVISSGSSLRPPSTASGVSAFSGRSARSSTSSVVSVRWDEKGLQNVKEMQRKERKAKRESAASNGTDRKASKESRKSSEARRRTPISEIFPDVKVQRPPSVASHSTTKSSVLGGPIVNVEEATADGHSDHGGDTVMETPVKKCIHQESDGVISILDAATNDLASLISRLDLEATPASCNGSPFNCSPLASFGSPSRTTLPADESPIKSRTLQRDQVLAGGLRESMASISSLRPYALAQSSHAIPTISEKPAMNAERIGQQIAPWSALDWEISPKKPVFRKPATGRPTHKRTLTPSPAIEPPPVFQPLKPAKRNISPVLTKSPTPSATTPRAGDPAQAPSSNTFGSKSSKMGVERSMEIDDDPMPSPCPVFRKSGGHIRSGSIVSAVGSTPSKLSLRKSSNEGSMPLAPEAKKVLGLTGTLGGSASTEPPVDPEDPDSDIPDELQVIIAGQSDEEFTRNFDDTVSFHRISPPPSPAESSRSIELPPVVVTTAMTAVASVPVFRAQVVDEEDNHADIDDAGNGSSEEDDTNKSFDFTGELQKLNESGASDRRSFVEQLENAFRTPARIDLGLDDGFLKASAPPIPPLPLNFRPMPSEDLVPRSVSDPEVTTTVENNTMDASFRDSAVSDTLDHLLAECQEDFCRPYPEMKRSNGSMRSKASDGQLNIDFKFGGKLSVPPALPEKEEKPLTLSDIIPPPSHYRSRSSSSILEDDSVLKSILAHVSEMPPPAVRPRANSDTSSRSFARDSSQISHGSSRSRTTSEASFTGFESFDEIRRGFEFGPTRPAFYPPPGANTSQSHSRTSHNKHESMYSVASVSSFGSVVNSGSVDPFGYFLSRPPSEDMSMSMSMSVDDTFSFMRKDPRRQRVDSDASSFYFRAPGVSQGSHQYRRGHRRNDSTMSTVSNAPPVSIYNKSFGVHRRNDSNTSASSVAQSYAMHGAYGGRASWARHRPDLSIDSVSSEYSAMRLGRPGIGDKMFDRDYGMPLTAISASPPESVSREPTNNPSNWDSIIDDHRTSAEDSLFEKTGYRSSYSSDESVFGFDGNHSDPGQLPPNHFRPLSMMSVASTHSAPKEDDTMISMIGGGHVRRRSVDSLIEASPCVKKGIEKRKQTLQKVGRVLKFDMGDDMPPPPVPKIISPGKTQITAKPSIASTSSLQFGGERMIKARQGLLERQSLEDSALMAHGEDLLASLCSQSTFSRPGPASRSRSSTVTESSGADTPPLSSSDGSSVSGGSQSSIDLGHLNTLLTGHTYPSSGIARARARQRARGTGHRRRISQAHVSRSSVYETIQEESFVLSSSPSPAKSSIPSVPASLTKAIASPVRDSVYIVDSDTQSLVSFSEDWDDERGIVGLRRYYALKSEAHETVVESKRVWLDTPFSIFAVQSFQPPSDKTGMQMMLEHSQKNYGPLPSELRPYRVRSRTSSRASPYPLRSLKSTLSPERTRSPRKSKTSSAFGDFSASRPFSFLDGDSTAPLQDVSTNVNVVSPPPVIDVKAFTPFAVKLDEAVKPEKNNIVLPVPARPRVTSSARRTALGWSKRSSGKASSKEQKENISQGTLATPGDSLRISRPRPRGRPTPARTATIRV